VNKQKEKKQSSRVQITATKLRSSVYNKKLDKKEQELEIHLQNCREISTIG
jgi:hypothetical protein